MTPRESLPSGHAILQARDARYLWRCLDCGWWRIDEWAPRGTWKLCSQCVENTMLRWKRAEPDRSSA